MAALPEAVQDAFWGVLEPNLAAVIDDAVGAKVAAFCLEHKLDEDALVPVVRGCRTLFLPAARRDLAVEKMAEDLTALCGGSGSSVSPPVRALLGCYSKALPRLRAQLVLDSLDDFGPVLEDVRLRVDHVPTSRHAPQTVSTVALLSLKYRDDAQRKRMTVQVPMPVLRKLKSLLDAVVK